MELPTLPANLKDWVETATPLFAIVGGFAAAWKGLQEIRLSRDQRELERSTREQELQQNQLDLRWRRAQAAKHLNDEMYANQHINQLTHMLDWPGDELVEVGADEVRTIHKITRTDFRSALVRPKARYTRKEQFICECVDEFCYYLAGLESATQSDLVTFADVEFPTDYYVSLLTNDKDVVAPYLRFYGLDRAESFLKRYRMWTEAPDTPLLGFDDVYAGSVVGTEGEHLDRDGRRNRLQLQAKGASPVSMGPAVDDVR